MSRCPECNSPEHWDKRIAELEKDRTNALALLKEALSFIGIAACHGYKCRLPHCESCYGEEAGEKGTEFEERAHAAIDAAREGK